ncbi:MAG: DUF58 domain-containing protein [Halobacteriaceae archaeon]
MNIAIAGFLLIFGALAERHLPVLAGMGVSTWVLAGQYAAHQQLIETADSLSIETNFARSETIVDRDITLTVTVNKSTTDTGVMVRISLPPSVTGPDVSERTIWLNPNDTQRSLTFSLKPHVAGEISMPDHRIVLEPEEGLFRESIARPSNASFIVSAKRPRNIHVGQGGESAAAYGEHPSGRGESGIVPEEVRRYVPGDAADRIDWKATARLNEPYVLEFEAETDRQTILIVDRRARLNIGNEGQTLLDVAREVSLGIADMAEEVSDPLGLVTVDEDGVSMVSPGSSPESYWTVREILHELDTSEANTTAGPTTPVQELRRDRIAKLGETNSTFAQTLLPLLSRSGRSIRHVERSSLVSAVHVAWERAGPSPWFVIITDDTERSQLQRAVQFAGQSGAIVHAFMLPRVLFETDALTELERAYDRYLEFEQFRRAIDSERNVSAFEVGPRDRLDAILSVRQQRQQR